MESVFSSCFLINICYAWNKFDFDNFIYLDENEEFHLLWSVLSDTKIEFALEVTSFGWIAMWFAPNGGMEGSDIVMGWVDEKDTVYLQNRYAIKKSEPLLMADQSNIEHCLKEVQ